MSSEAALRAWLLQEAGDMSWCRQVSRSSFVTGSWHQTEADLTTNPVGSILLCYPVPEERTGSFSCVVVSPPRGHGSFVANFAQKVILGQLPLSVRRLRGERVELFGRSAALFPSLNYHL